MRYRITRQSEGIAHTSTFEGTLAELVAMFQAELLDGFTYLPTEKIEVYPTTIESLCENLNKIGGYHTYESINE